MAELASLKFPHYYWDKDKKILFRSFLESKHILWVGRLRGVCAFNLEIYNQYKDEAKYIGFHYKNVRYTTTSDLMNKFGEILTYEEPQIACPLACYQESKI